MRDYCCTWLVCTSSLPQLTPCWTAYLATLICHIFTYWFTVFVNVCLCQTQGDHSPGKHGKVRELDSGLWKVRENGKREKSGKVIITILQLHEKDIIAFLRYQSRQLNRRQAPASPAPQTYRRRRSTGVIDVDNRWVDVDNTWRRNCKSTWTWSLTVAGSLQLPVRRHFLGIYFIIE